MATNTLEKTFYIEVFIILTRECPSIWNSFCEDYSNKIKRNDTWLELFRGFFF